MGQRIRGGRVGAVRIGLLVSLVVAVLAAAVPAGAQGGPKLILLGGSVTEGDSGTVKAHFGVALHFDPQSINCQPGDADCNARTLKVCVDFHTAPGSATSPEDFEEKAGTLQKTVTIPGGEIEIPVGSIDVDVKGDTIDEPNETFRGILSLNPDCEPVAGLGVSEAEMTITDDDGVPPPAPPPPPEVAINDVTIREGDEGNRKVAFTISLSRPGVGVVSVSYRSANGTATGGPTGDYLPVQGAVTFRRFATSQQVDVTIRGDGANESNETFTVELLKATGATIVDATGTGTVVDDD